MTWAKEQVETFADLFRRQVYASTIGPGIAEECIKVTASHNRKVSTLSHKDLERIAYDVVASRRGTRFYIPPLNSPSTGSIVYPATSDVQLVFLANARTRLSY